MPAPNPLKRGRTSDEASGSDVDAVPLLADLNAFLTTYKAGSSSEEPLLLLLRTCKTLIGHLSARLSSPAASFEEAVEEDKRLRSVVVEGLPESPSPLASGRSAEDLSHIHRMLDVANVEHRPMACYRMGEMTDRSGKVRATPRPVKILFPCRSAQASFLRAARSIRSSAHYPQVFVRPSLTKQQRKEAFDLRVKRREMVKAGQDVVIYDGRIMERNAVAQYRASRTRMPSTAGTSQSLFSSLTYAQALSSNLPPSPMTGVN